jgi:hypothetical protein
MLVGQQNDTLLSTAIKIGTFVRIPLKAAFVLEFRCMIMLLYVDRGRNVSR